MFELPGTPAMDFSKRRNLVSIEGVYRASSRNLFKDIRRENYEKSLVDYKGLMLFIGGGVPKFELLGTPARESSKTWNLVSIEDYKGVMLFIGGVVFKIELLVSN